MIAEMPPSAKAELEGPVQSGVESSEPCGSTSLSVYWGSEFPTAQLFGTS